jgi:hypothetical protein
MYTQSYNNFFWGGTSFGASGFGTCTGTIACAANTILYVINGVLVPVLYGIAQAYIFSHGDPEKVKSGHHTILWGIVAFAVMISIWGLVNVVANTFGLGGYYAPPTPTSISPYGSATGGAIYGQQSQPTTYVECPKDENGNCK